MLRRRASTDWSLQLYPETWVKLLENVGLASTAATPLIWPLIGPQSRRTQFEGGRPPSLPESAAVPPTGRNAPAARPPSRVASFALGTVPSFDSLISTPVTVSFLSFFPAIERLLMFLPFTLIAAYPVPPRATKSAKRATTIEGEGRLENARRIKRNLRSVVGRGGP